MTTLSPEQKRKNASENTKRWRAKRTPEQRDADSRKRRESRVVRRSTKAEMAAFRWALFDIVEDMWPMTVRQVFYQATVRGLVEKSEKGYAKVQQQLAKLRQIGTMPYGWLVDHTRVRRRPWTYDNVQEAITEAALSYRKALWRNIPAYVEIWIEKDALVGVIEPVTEEYDVMLCSARGYASLTFLHNAATYIKDCGVPVYIYHFGDHDPSGVNAAENIDKRLKEMAPASLIFFERVAVTPEQIEKYDLPARPTKESDTRAKYWFDASVELDAIEPDVLRGMVREVIERHMDPGELARLKNIENAERETYMEFANNFSGSEE